MGTASGSIAWSTYRRQEMFGLLWNADLPATVKNTSSFFDNYGKTTMLNGYVFASNENGNDGQVGKIWTPPGLPSACHNDPGHPNQCEQSSFYQGDWRHF